MKKILLALCMIISSLAYSQVPRKISYQGVLADGSGNFIPDGNHSLTIRLYEAASGGTAVYEESQSTAIVKGLFNLIIGSVTPIPTSLPFDRAYYLGVSVDGGAELVPRTAISAAPFAMYASVAGVANSLAPGVTGVVTSLNEKSGAVTLQGGGGTTITSAGNVITVSSTGGGGGTGIQGVQSTDGSIGITNSTGPIADLSIPAGSITTARLANEAVTAGKIASGVIPTSLPPSGAAGGDLSGTYPNPSIDNAAVTTSKLDDEAVVTSKIADNAVTSAKIGSGAATNGQVLTADGSGNTSWTTVSGGGGLTLPYSNSVANASTLFDLTNTGTGKVGQFAISNSANTATTLTSLTSGTGRAGYFESTNTSSSAFVLDSRSVGTGASIAVYGGNSGTGRGGYFEILNASSTATALTGNTQGLGTALVASNVNSANTATTMSVTTNGTGKAALITNSNSTTTGNTLEVTAAGTGSAVAGIYAKRGAGSGIVPGSNRGVFGDNETGFGVAGASAGNAGVAGFSSASYGVYGLTSNSGWAGVFGRNDQALGAAVEGQSVSGGATGVRGTSHTGSGGRFETTNSSNTSDILFATTNGSGSAIKATRTATTGTAPVINALSSSTAGSHFVIYGEATSTSPSANSTGVRGVSKGTAGNGIGVWGSHDGYGWGVNGTVSGDGIGVRGVSSGAGYGVYGTTSGAGYGVYGGTDGAGVGGVFEAANGGNALIADIGGSTASTTTANNIAIFRDAGTRRARIDRTGKGFFNGGTQNSGADVAEAFAVVGDITNYEPGDVLVIAAGHKRTVEKNAKAYATNVIGVHATKPGVLLTEHDIDVDISHLVPMGVVGVLPTKVTSQGGAIKAGDLLVTSSKMGYAMKGDPRKMKIGMVIGKALEDFDGKEGIINVFVNVK